MLEWLLIGVIIFSILLFFHNRANYEFHINQIRWNQRDKLGDLLNEKSPIVVQDIPLVAFWTQQDILMWPIYADVPVFTDEPMSQWLMRSDREVACPWKSDHATLLGLAAGLDIWAERILNPLLQSNPLWSAWLRPEVSCWAGARGLWQTAAPWTALFVSEGSVQVSVMPGSLKKSLPPVWNDTVHPSQLTVYDTPFAADLKFMDIILRPGHCLLIPSHWFVSWLAQEASASIPMICSVEYHSPISLLGRLLSRSQST
jgi:hypothetical protein